LCIGRGNDNSNLQWKACFIRYCNGHVYKKNFHIVPLDSSSHQCLMLLCQVYSLFALAFQKFLSYTGHIFYKKSFHTCSLHTAYKFGLAFLQFCKHSGFQTFLRYKNMCVRCLHSVQNIVFDTFIFPLSKNKINLPGELQEEENFTLRF
jgi:hypothetical protein